MASRLEPPQRPNAHRLAPQTEQLFACLLEGVELLQDRRVRRLELERSNPNGEWIITAAMSFEGMDGQPRPFRPEQQPPKRWRSREERQP
jgi:hypothetical protein